MVNLLGKFFVGIFGSHVGIATVIISMFPLVELKGGIPVGMSTDFWGEYALGGTESFLLAMLGSCLVVPIIALIFKPIINFLKRTKLFRKLGQLIDDKVKNHSESINKKTKDEKSSRKKIWTKMLFIFTFVAIPLPLTGVWTGTCVAVAIGLNLWQTVLSCVLGNMVAGLIIVTVCAVFPEFTTILFLIFLLIILIVCVWGIIKVILNKKKAQALDGANSNLSDSNLASSGLTQENGRNISKVEIKESIKINPNDVKVTHIRNDNEIKQNKEEDDNN